MSNPVIRLTAALALVLLLAAPALAWTEFHLKGLTPGKRYTLTITAGARFQTWKQEDVARLKVHPHQLSFVATEPEAVLNAALHLQEDRATGTITPSRGVTGTISARGYHGTLAHGVWALDFPEVPATCTANPSCPSEFCPPGQRCYFWQGRYYCCWLDPGRPLN